jgi:hypothetical protein
MTDQDILSEIVKDGEASAAANTQVVEQPSAPVILDTPKEQPAAVEIPNFEFNTAVETVEEDVFKKELGYTATEIKEKLAEIESLRTKVTPEFQYKSPLGKLADELIDKGYSQEESLKVIDLLSKDLTTLSAKEKIIFSMQEKFPYLTKEELNARFEKDYNLDNDDLSDNDKLLIQSNIKVAEKEAEKTLIELKEQYMKGKEAPSTVQTAAEQARNDFWKTNVSDVVKGFDKIVVPIGEGKWSFEIKPEEKAQMEQALLNGVTYGKVEPTKEGIAQARAMLEAHYVATNLSKIVTAATNWGRGIAEEKWAKLINNPSALANKANSFDTTKVDTEDQRIMDLIDKA